MKTAWQHHHHEPFLRNKKVAMVSVLHAKSMLSICIRHALSTTLGRVIHKDTQLADLKQDET